MNIREEGKKIRVQLEEEEGAKVRVALFGQPGAGKSSLINKLVGAPIARVGAATDVTRDASDYEWNGIILTDLPGYDTARFPRSTYFERFKILTFDLFLCVFSGKLHHADSEFFEELKRVGKVCLFVRNKRDELWEPEKKIEDLEGTIREDVVKQVKSQENVYFTSCRDDHGLADVNGAIFNHLDAAKRERWARSAKAYSGEALQRKKEICESLVARYAGLSAANALNPIEGLNVSLDLGLLVTLFGTIRGTYGLTEEALQAWSHLLPAAGKMINRVLQYATTEGVIALLRRYAGRELAKEVAKYVPFVGQAFAALLGWQITTRAGMAYLKDCHELAEEILEYQLKHPGQKR